MLQVLNAEFETETAALRDQAKAEAAAAIAVLESRVVVAERARQEGVAQGEEQERLLKEGRRREARLQETNKALVGERFPVCIFHIAGDHPHPQSLVQSLETWEDFQGPLDGLSAIDEVAELLETR